MSHAHCPLCALPPDRLLWSGAGLHVLDVADSPFPGYTRVIWQDHVAEMTDLAPAQRQRLMEAVYLVEETQRAHLLPTKINLAQFGNQVPHLHWHVIPRWSADPLFPDSAWSPAPGRTPEQQQAWTAHRQNVTERMRAFHAQLKQALTAHFASL